MGQNYRPGFITWGMDLKGVEIRLAKMEKVVKSLGVKLAEDTKNNKSDVKLHLVAIKDQLHTAWQSLKGERLKRAAVGFLESLVGLALEDHHLIGHWGNSYAYLDAGLTALQVYFLSSSSWSWCLKAGIH